MEIGPTCHYAMGGIEVDPETELAVVPGLYAVGECSGGMHGSNRLGGNSLGDLLVFGKRAGEYAAKFAKERGAVTVDQGAVDDAARFALAPLERSGSGNGSAAGDGPYQIQYKLQAIMQEGVGIVRRDAEMRKALDAVLAMRQEAERVSVPGNREYNPGWHTALDLRNLLTISEAVARAAIDRTESRGGHFRDDHPDKDPGFATFNITLRKGADGSMYLERIPIPPMPAELRAVVEENK
jgi:succinate dehydrogenase / fumarate reductase, flavoprotein subunit